MDAVAPKNIKRKPSPKDPLHPTKAEFIRAKHVNLSFILKPNQLETDDNVNLEIELSKQLHASVRSGNLETSLRLLVQGADPNFFHEVSLVLRIVGSSSNKKTLNNSFSLLLAGERFDTIAVGIQIGPSITN